MAGIVNLRMETPSEKHEHQHGAGVILPPIHPKIETEYIRIIIKNVGLHFEILMAHKFEIDEHLD
jgi:hypothetical protein